MGFWQHPDRQEGEGEAEHAQGCHHGDVAVGRGEGKERPLHRVEQAARDVGRGGRHGGAQVGAELLGGDGHEQGPKAHGQAEAETQHIIAHRRQAAQAQADRDQGCAADQEDGHGLAPTGQALGQEAGADVANNQPNIAPHDGIGADHGAGHPEHGRGLRGEEHKDADHEPGRSPERDREQIAADACRRAEQQGQAALRNGRIESLEHPRFMGLPAQCEQSEAHHAADDESLGPSCELAYSPRENGPGDTDAGDDGGAVRALGLGQAFDHEGDANTQLAREAEAGDHAQDLKLPDTGDEAIQQRRGGIDDDRSEQRRQPAPAIRDHAPHETANQHADHLQTKQVPESCGNVRIDHSERFQAAFADHADQHDVVDVDEVAEGRDDDGQREQAPGGATWLVVAGRWLERAVHRARMLAAAAVVAT